MFKIANAELEVSSAVLEAFEDDGVLCWSVEISASPADLVGQVTSPKLTIDIALTTGAGELGDWTDLAGRSREWIPPYNEEEEAIALLYMATHDPLYEAKLSFWSDNGGLGVEIAGKCDPAISLPGQQTVDVFVRTSLVFQGVWCSRMSETESTTIVSQFFKTARFEFERTADGVSLMSPR